MAVQVFSGVDHIMVRVEKVEPFLILFSDMLGLPVSWPLQQMEFADYAWVTLGNTNLEFWASANNLDLPSDQTLPLFPALRWTRRISARASHYLKNAE